MNATCEEDDEKMTIKKHIFPCGLLMVGLLMLATTSVFGATGYEVSNVGFDQAVMAGQYVRVTDDLTVTWNAPSDPTNKVMDYILKFDTSSTALTDNQFSISVNDFMVDVKLPTKQIIPVSFFSAYNSDKVYYLHVKTQYFDATNGPVYSDDIVIGPVLIDNVAPTGAITLNPTSGSTTQIVVTLAPSESIKNYYLSESAGNPGIAQTYSSAQVNWTLQSTTYGAVPIYAWFEDQAGNRSQAVTASYTYQAPLQITCTNNATEIRIGASLTCTVDQATAYNWTITPSVSGVAEFSGGGVTSNNHASVTIDGKATGTFTLSAVPTAGGNTLTSGTMSVAGKPGDVNNDGDITLDDVRLTFGFFLGNAATASEFAAANVYDDGDGNASISLHDVKGVFTLFLGGTL